MEFESPDVEKDFPGLYSSETNRKNNDSDFSDESHEKSFKSDLIGKRKEKKESKKDRGYAALEGESSPDEGDAKSPSKSKKSKSFKFPVKKSEKREKSRDKDAKEKETEKDKKKDREKKEKVKQKERKKSKQGDDGADVALGEEHAVFGATLSLAVERLGCLDGVGIPIPVRHCIDCIHSGGLSMEGLYKSDKVAGMKSKLQTLRRRYNARETVNSSDMDVPVAVSLLISFLKDLPEPILTNELLARFEEAGAVQDVAQREEELAKLLTQLPECNSVLLAWIILHFDQVTQHEKQNKINAQSIAMTFSPVLQMSHRLLTALLCHCKTLFTDTNIVRYIPPLAPGSQFPEEPKGLSIELKKQEALLNQIHREMNEGFVSKKREELLWEVQRIVTQLKRKLRSLNKSQDTNQMQRSLDEDHSITEDVWKKRGDDNPKENTVSIENPVPVPVLTESQPSSVAVTTPIKPAPPLVEDSCNKSESVSAKKTETHTKIEDHLEHSQPKGEPLSFSVPPVPQDTPNVLSDEEENQETPLASPEEFVNDNPIYDTTISTPWEEEAKLQLEHVELLKLQSKLQERLKQERWETEKMRVLIDSYRGIVDSASENSSANSSPTCRSPETEARIEELLEENQQLMQQKDELVRRILEEREACIKLNVSINYLKLEQMYKAS